MRKLHSIYLLFILIFGGTCGFARNHLSLAHKMDGDVALSETAAFEINGINPLTAPADIAAAPGDFITVWDMNKPVSQPINADRIRFNMTSTAPVAYTWTASGGGSGSGSTTTGIITGLPVNQIITLSMNPVHLKTFSFSTVNPSTTTETRLIDIIQWGTVAWSSMANAFSGASNLNITATDLPDLSGVTNMSSMFTGCSLLNGPANIGSWDTSTITNMSYMFGTTTNFNQNIGNWNTANVTNMNGMFSNAVAFNQNIGNWNTENVTSMSQMFYNAKAFNQDIGNWNTGNVTLMTQLFRGATNFNQNIGNWDTAKVIDMSYMFQDAVTFNQNISNWNTANVTSMYGMFDTATAFNQNISNWNTARVTTMRNMFSNAAAFNQNLGSWNLRNSGVNMLSMLDNSGMDCVSYSATLMGWANNPNTPVSSSLGAIGRQYGTNALAARTTLTTKNWTITGDSNSGTICIPPLPFITVWDMSKPGSGGTQLTFNMAYTAPAPYSWTASGGSTGSGTTTGTITGLPAGEIITLSLEPANLKAFNLFTNTNNLRLINVSQWGTVQWNSMFATFYQCQNLNITATDLPDLSQVTNAQAMFAECSVLNGPANIGDWNTSNITNMSQMFSRAYLFNQNIGNWNTGNVTNMSEMFSTSTVFNQNIGNWDTSKVTDMNLMFGNAPAFNQDIGNWNTANVTNMHQMFRNAIAFNQNLGNWQLNPNVNMDAMLFNAGMDCVNYSATLRGWANNPNTPNGRYLNAQGRQYSTNAAQSRTTLTTGKGWTITGDSPSGTICGRPFVTVWDMSKSSESQSTPTSLRFGITTSQNRPVNYIWTASDGSSGSGTFTTSSSAEITGLPAGEIITLGIASEIIAINIAANSNNDKRRLIDIAQWGDAVWSTMENAFSDCVNLNVTATDIPNLSAVSSMRKMFNNCQSMTGPANIGSWNTATVNNMESLFTAALVFDQDISSWNTANVTNMAYLFSGARAFNQDLSNWNTTNVTNMEGMFQETRASNLNISNWNTQNVRNMQGMFAYSSVFNEDISNWNTSNVTSMSNMFRNSEAFNQNISSWNTARVTDMSGMFAVATSFNQPIGNWNTASVTNMFIMFASAENFNQDIDNWNTSAVINMSGMFDSATVFNKPIGNWNTAAVTDMHGMFNRASSFNQDISHWNMSSVLRTGYMFVSATAFNQNIGNWQFNPNVDMTNMLDYSGMDCQNYSLTLNGWANNPNIPSGRNFGASSKQYGTNAETARNFLINTKGWTITGDNPSGQNCGLSQTITANDMTKTYGDIPFVPNATASSDLEVSYASADNSIAEAFQDSSDGNKWKLKINKAGVVNITAKQAGNDTYAPAADVIFTLTINKAALTITANALSKEYGTTDPTLTFTAIGFVNGEDQTIITGVLTRIAGEAVGTYAITQGTLDAENYSIAYTGEDFTITAALEDFVTVWDMSKPDSGNNNIRFYPTISPNGSVDYFWMASGGSTGNGTIAAGTYEVNISGLPANEIITLNLKPTHLKAIKIRDLQLDPERLKLIDVTQWGTAQWSTMKNAFIDCRNLNITATDVPDLSNVADMSRMFQGCRSLNGPTNIGTWNTANVTNMFYLFYGTSIFNQNIGDWNTSNVTNMGGMFQGANLFNQNIGNWNTQNVTDMLAMFFEARAFNQDVANWNTSNVTNMIAMFFEARAFNQDISNWDTQKVIGMFSMFNMAQAFNQNIGTWQLNPAVTMDNMLDNSGMDCQNYSFTLQGWAANPNTPSGRNLGAQGRQYGTNAEAARTALTTTKGWTITGDIPSGQNCGLSQTITANDITKTYGDMSFVPTATASSGLEVSYTSADNSIAETFQDSADGNKWKLKINKAGVVNITAQQAGNDTYAPAADVIFTLTINKAALTVTANAHSKIYGTTDPTLTYVVNGLVNGDTETVISGLLTRAAGENIGTYAIEQGTLSAENYVITYTGADFNITKATLNIVTDAKSKAFGATDPALTYTVTGLLNGDTESIITGSLSRAVGEAVGIYTITQGTLSAGNNYEINFTGADFTIIERLVVDTSTQTNVTCNGGSDGSATVSITGGTAPYSYSWSPNGGTAATATGLAAGDYTVTITDANGSTITKDFNISEPQAVEPPTAEDVQEFCRAANPTISDLEIVGTQVKWYASATVTQELPENTLLVDGTIYYASQTINGCESQERTLVIIILNDQLPTPQGAPIQDLEEGATIADLVVTPSNVVWYAGYDDAVNNSNPLSPTTELENGTTYYAVAMANGQCSSLPFAVTVNVTLGIGKPQEMTFKYYPNPVEDYLNIQSSGIIEKIEIYSMLGQLVKKQDCHSGEVRLFFGDLPDGTYAVSILSEGKKSTVKVIKK